jgi:predicted acetyltransferase
MTDDYPLRPVAPDQFAAFLTVGERAFNSNWPLESLREHELGTFEFDRSIAAFDGDLIVGSAAAYTFRLAVPGGELAGAAGVTAVSVLPSHRRRGILSAMMRHQLADIRDRGESIAALFASEPGIYGRYGYGCSSEHLQFTVRRGETQLVPSAPRSRPAAAIRLRESDPDKLLPELAKVYDLVLPGRPGMPARDDRWWRNAIADPEFSRNGMGPLRCMLAEDDSGPRGYALYAARPDWADEGIPSHALVIRELMAADPEATAALWADLLTRDLVGEVRVRQRPADDALLHLLADRRRARALLSDGLWIRLTDVPAALCQRGYARDIDVVLEVTDELIPDNAGRWRLQASGTAPAHLASCERSGQPADLALPVSALGAAYLGGTRLGALAAAGQVTELRAGKLAELSAAMMSDPAPWCPRIF